MRPPVIEILAIGNELLLGETVDTNSPWIAQRLAVAGIRVTRTTVTGDDVAAIRAALAGALERTGTVVCTGGLGPTVDDRTRHAVAELYGGPLTIDESWVDVLRERYRLRGLEMPAINRVQAELPEGARLIPNPRGTAPAIVAEDERLGMTVLLPGVPAEMRALMEQSVVALLEQRLRPAAPLLIRVLRTTGIPESALAERVADLAADTGPVELAFLPHVAGVDLRLSCAPGESEQAVPRLDALFDALRDRLADLVYADAALDLAAVVGDLLRARRLTLAVAESCTGGLLSKRLTDAAGASDFMLAGFTTYANEAKHELLGVQPRTLAEHGAVSEACAVEMAAGVRRVARADVGVSITGIAGPGGGSVEKPVGLVWVAVSTAAAADARRFIFPGDRGEIRERAAQAALDMLRRRLGAA